MKVTINSSETQVKVSWEGSGFNPASIKSGSVGFPMKRISSCRTVGWSEEKRAVNLGASEKYYLGRPDSHKGAIQFLTDILTQHQEEAAKGHISADIDPRAGSRMKNLQKEKDKLIKTETKGREMNIDTKTLTRMEGDCLLCLLRCGDCEGTPYPTRDNLAYFTLDHCLDQVRSFKRMEESLGNERDPTLKSLLSKLEQQNKLSASAE